MFSEFIEVMSIPADDLLQKLNGKKKKTQLLNETRIELLFPAVRPNTCIWL